MYNIKDNKIDNKVLQIRIKDLEKMLQDKQEEMNEYINELDHMVIERSNLIEKTNTQSSIINTLQNEVKSVKEKFRELVRLSEEYRNDMENQLEEMERKLEEKKIIDIKKEEEAIEKLKKEALEEIDKQLEEMDKMKEKRQEEIKQSCEVIRNEMLRKARNERDEIGREVLELREELKDLELVRGEFLLQEIGMLENPYEYETSQEFQEKLNIIKKEQKEMVRNGEALVFSTTWTVANSKTKGDKFMKGISKLALKSFNNECDNIIINVKYSSMSIAKDKIEKSFKDTNKFIQVMECAITDEYLELKIKELLFEVIKLSLVVAGCLGLGYIIIQLLNDYFDITPFRNNAIAIRLEAFLTTLSNLILLDFEEYPNYSYWYEYADKLIPLSELEVA